MSQKSNVYSLVLMSPQNGTDLVPWNSLLVITNVPPSCSSDVQKLVQRFGTVINTLMVNNMVRHKNSKHLLWFC